MPRELPPRARRILAPGEWVMRPEGTTSACAENTGGCLVLVLHDGNYLRVRGEYGEARFFLFGDRELPPRARRIPTTPPPGAAGGGTTSACAENTFDLLPKALFEWNYLRVRGEYQKPSPWQLSALELPPRARRIPKCKWGGKPPFGTTSACAENTGCIGIISVLTWNYLRVRGEYLPSLLAARHTSELPPRARRILTGGFGFLGFEGTTSACAENTSFPRLQQRLCKNYLRVRGEYTWGATESCDQAELPPRARRIRQIHDQGVGGEGTTSACAENTRHHGLTPPHPWNYLRVRGEYVMMLARRSWILELPPRARRILNASRDLPRACGTTSACAENTARSHRHGSPKRNYLRVRGEYITSGDRPPTVTELPPRARRILVLSDTHIGKSGTTSACAENTLREHAVDADDGNYLRVRGEYFTLAGVMSCR